VQAIEPGVVHWKDGVIEADTIVLAAGIVPSAVAAAIEVERDRRGRIVTDGAMRSVSHPHVWAIGDCAAIPGPDGKPYPALAQHAVRGLELAGFIAWWMRRTYYLFQMPRWDTRVRIALDWTVSLFFRPDLTKVDLAPEREQERRNCPAGGSPSRAAAAAPVPALPAPR
jgi:NADH dehydrogenase